MPRICVLLPVHDARPYLREAVLSVLDQSYRDFRLLVVDDGSSDGGVDVLADIDDPRLEVVANARNLGQAETLNRCLDGVSEELIARMDADDIALPTRFERQVAYLDAHPTCGIVGTWIETFSAEGTSIWRLPTDHDVLRSELLFRSVIAHPTVMIRREALGDLRYRTDVPPIEDWDLWQRAGARTRLANIPEIHLRYRVKSDAERGVTGPYLYDPVRLARQRTVVRSHLEKLGLQPTEAECDLHLRVGDHALAPQLERVADAEAWLLRLLDANGRSQMYDSTAFERTIGRLWFFTAYSFADRRTSSVRRLLASPLRRLLWHVAPLEWAKYAARLIRGRGLAGWDVPSEAEPA